MPFLSSKATTSFHHVAHVPDPCHTYGGKLSRIVACGAHSALAASASFLLLPSMYRVTVAKALVSSAVAADHPTRRLRRLVADGLLLRRVSLGEMNVFALRR